MISYRWIDRIEDFHEIANEWDSLLLSKRAKRAKVAEEDNFFLLSDFILTWWKYYQSGRRLSILAFYEKQKLIGGIPLCIKREGIKCGGLRFMTHLGEVAANYTEPFFCAPKDIFFSVFEKALQARGDWDILFLTDLRHRHFCVSGFQTRAYPFIFPYHEAEQGMNWSIDISCGFEKYLQSLSGRFKKDLRLRRRRLLEQRGEIRLVEISGRGDIEKHFDMYADFSKTSFDGRGGESNFTDPLYRAFFREFLVLMDEKKRLSCHALLAGDQVLAIAFGYRLRNELNLVLTSFNLHLKEYRPGYLLIEEMIKKVDATQETSFNMFGGERFYKRQWGNRVEPLYQIKIYRNRGIQYIDEGLQWGKKVKNAILKKSQERWV